MELRKRFIGTGVLQTTIISSLSGLLFICANAAIAADMASAYIISPQDGAVVSSPVKVVFGLRGMGVAPAGVKKDNTGHFHLIIDKSLPSASKPIPKDNNHRHYGGGQTETSVDLPKGKHTLQLVMGDHAHMQHKTPVVSKPINITVK